MHAISFSQKLFVVSWPPGKNLHKQFLLEHTIAVKNAQKNEANIQP